jgi:hypothetical protein
MDGIIEVELLSEDINGPDHPEAAKLNKLLK